MALVRNCILNNSKKKQDTPKAVPQKISTQWMIQNVGADLQSTFCGANYMVFIRRRNNFE